MSTRQQPNLDLARRMANAIRMLAVDAVEAAQSGHPGAPMGMADIAEVLWNRHLRHNPANPAWADRDRFVLSNGHGSMLLYALLHLTGYELSMDDLRQFRRLHSKTAGHPEVGVTPGVETTTGPLGQGLANAVGMALAEKLLAIEFNRPGHNIVDHHTYVFLGDGCLMEGISHEACSLAGTLRLSKLVALYDDNGISIDGHVQGWFTDDTPRRFAAYGWDVVTVDGHDPGAIDAALRRACSATAQAEGKPTLICCKTVIGKGAPNKQGSPGVHGAALGAVEVQATREALGWTSAPFEIPADIAAAWNATERGHALEAAWQARFEAYREAFPTEAVEYDRRMRGALPKGFAEGLPALVAALGRRTDAVATRKASQLALDAMAPQLPEIFGGSADLTSSNLTNFKGCVTAGPNKAGRFSGGKHLSYGVREFGMAAIMNGLALHGGFIPYGGTFLAFSDYSRNAVRMAALMKLQVVHVFTHDSIGLGEDGPTHQPVEQVPSLRLIPGLDVWRPADALETAAAWAHALQRRDGPTALALSRQNLPQLGDASRAPAILRGGYVLSDMDGAQAVIVATGSETSLALQAQTALAAEGIATRVVSMPCTNLFDRQDAAWQDAVLPPELPAVAVEAAHPDFWRKYVGRSGRVVGMSTFGESAPAKDLYAHFGITAARVADEVRALLQPRRRTYSMTEGTTA
ncbi:MULTISPECIES: transketolase [Burkholderiales]|uniref:Transketolase n=1 Tax=Achromobacter veterisilvae TaxID=2069367 RepID=A0A446CSV5_9BURK|nr:MULTISPECIES: transketolase [Burkholderiales]BEG78281.1 Transketolase 1 [Achromobacter xylosoxidans]SSW70922.1 Transketolase 1 [Achromobacter veterisilvae]